MLSSRMAQLLVRNLSDETVVALKRRAAQHGRSVEAEHRIILEDALSAERRERVTEWLTGVRTFQEALGDRTFDESTEILRELRDSS